MESMQSKSSAVGTTSARSKTVGLYTEDTRLYYIDKDFVVLDDPIGVPTLIKRTPGDPTRMQVTEVLKAAKMEVVAYAYHSQEGLWYQHLKAKEVNS